jgi:molybdopterin/thiamine biosynthesis adenylyltransferase/rhodanese-related sulfurtransferase
MTTAVPESVYYARHFQLPGFTASTQSKLRAARILVVGVGGLGCSAALHLAGAGVGVIGLCDADYVSATNLHRQVLFDIGCIGQLKVQAAARRLRAINPNIQIEEFDQHADANLLHNLALRYDLILDGTDSFVSKYTINDVCEATKVPLVHGSIFQYEGMVSVFHSPTAGHPAGISYRDVFPGPPPSGLAQNCGEAGVIGVLPGIIGSLQANEAIKLISGLGETLAGSLLIFDGLTSTIRRVKVAPRNPGTEARTLADVDLQMIDDVELCSRLLSDAPPLLIDVRELHERVTGSLGGEHIPLATLPTRVFDLPRDRDIVVYCKSGIRSARAALYLRSLLGTTAIFCLSGGIEGTSCRTRSACAIV